MADEPLSREFTKGLWRENGLFVMALGLCPALAVTTSVLNGVVMGLCVTFVLTGSNLVVSLIRSFTPKEIRIRHIGNCMKADPDYGKGVAEALGIPLSDLPKEA